MSTDNKLTLEDLIKTTRSTSIWDMLDNQTLEKFIKVVCVDYSCNPKNFDLDRLANLYRIYSLRVSVPEREVFAKALALEIAKKSGSLEFGLRPILMGECYPSIDLKATMDLAYIIMLQHGSANGPESAGQKALREFFEKPLPEQITP